MGNRAHRGHTKFKGREGRGYAETIPYAMV